MLREQLIQQGTHRLPAAGGHDHLRDTGASSAANQALDTGPQLQTTVGHEVAVMALLGSLQTLHPLRFR